MSGAHPRPGGTLDELLLYCGRHAALAGLLLLGSVIPVAGQDPPPSSPDAATGAVSGRVLDDRSLEPVPEVTVRIAGTDLETLSDERGMFALTGIPVGQRRLVLEHLSYGEHGRWIDVRSMERLILDARVSTRAIELAPLLVETLSELDRRRITSGAQMNEVTRPEADQAHRTGRSLAELIREHIPGASIRSGRFGGACLEFRGGRAGGGACRELTTFVDGVRIADPGLFLTTVPPNQIERMEILSSAEAGARYGSVGGFGVLLVETRRPPRRRTPGRPTETSSIFDWSQEPSPHAWKRVLASSFVANAVGVGLSLALANQCLWRTEAGSLGLRTRCGGAATTAIGVLSLGLPAIGGSIVANWSGETERSRGRVTPTSLAAAMGVTSGYMLLIHGTGPTETMGVALLGVGVPVLMTLADRIFRSLR